MAHSPDEVRVYHPRRAAASPLYRIVQDSLETYLAEVAPDARNFCAEEALRRFLECGVHRFGVVRFLCRGCGADLVVAFSCRRRLCCPACDSKRALIATARAMENLLPRVPWRQWVLVLPKRLRYFVDRNPALAGEVCRMLTSELSRCYLELTDSPAGAAPAGIFVVQRFGSAVNLHVHIHAVISDGTFDSTTDGRLVFRPAPEPDAEIVRALTRRVRHGILRRMARIRAVPQEAVDEMLARPHGGFSLNGKVRVEPEDRAGLERLLSYCLRPAVSLKRLRYDADSERVFYRPIKRRPGDPDVLEWTPLAFLKRLAPIIAPPRLNLVRYVGALGPRSRLRPMVTAAARQEIERHELLKGVRVPVSRIAVSMRKAAVQAATAASRAWAAFLKRVFEVSPILCQRCGIEMVPVAAIVAGEELVRLLTHLGLPVEFPKTKPARSPPLPFRGEESQIDPSHDAFDGVDEDWGRHAA